MFKVPNDYRVRNGQFGTDESAGNNGAFVIPSPIRNARQLVVVASDGMDWEHVSIHARVGHAEYTPYWEEMAFIKKLFWDGDEWVLQFHPPADQYVNDHPNVLHLWRPVSVEVPTPPVIMV